ncbi:hypothetical protein BOVA208_3945 [Bacteroides ovatus]|nr:hypothetical protein BOVA208_3945 [Bacteroides ovatus]
MILATERMVFVTGPENSDRFIENLRTEYNTGQYRIRFNRTPPCYELFHECQESKRSLNSQLFASSRPEKIVNYINKTSNNSPK